MKSHRLAVLSSNFGLPSHTFIHRHMMELLPGDTAIVVRRRAPDVDESSIPSPFLNLDSRKDLRWLSGAASYLLKLSDLSPVQVKTEQFLRRHGVEVMLAEFLQLALRWLPVARKLEAGFFAHAHGQDISATLRDPAMRRRYLELEAADGIITMSEASRRRLVDLGLSDSLIHVIPYGVTVPSAFHRRPQNDLVRCLAVGRMVEKKAPLVTLDAFRQARAEQPRMTLDFVGDGELFERARTYADDHGLKDSVVFHGSLPNEAVQKLMKEADVFLQHSRTDPRTGDEEGLPVAILEAMANGLPVISTRHAGIPEAVQDGTTGCLVDENDVAGMADCIMRLATNPGAREQMGYAGWLRAGERFSWQRERTDLLRLLGLAGPPAPDAGVPG